MRAIASGPVGGTGGSPRRTANSPQCERRYCNISAVGLVLASC